jgi:hypothetical protein
MRPELLPEIPSRRTAGRNHRHLDLPHRIPMRGAGLIAILETSRSDKIRKTIDASILGEFSGKDSTKVDYSAA